MAATDPSAALAHWRVVRERLFREHPQSPVAAAERSGFEALHFKPDPGLRFKVELVPPEATGPAEASSRIGALSLGDEAALRFSAVGHVTIPFDDGPRRLAVYWMAGYAGGLFLPFRDTTNGHETYGAGRYAIDAAKGADLGGDPVAGTIVVDFNFAFQPSCTFDARWVCPLAPPENRLDRPIRAGERLA